MRVPDFMVRQFYVSGSLQHEGDGFRIQARNGMGDGTLVGIGSITVDGVAVDPAAVTATRAGEDVVHRAAGISRAAPVSFGRGDMVTCVSPRGPIAFHSRAPNTRFTSPWAAVTWRMESSNSAKSASATCPSTKRLT